MICCVAGLYHSSVFIALCSSQSSVFTSRCFAADGRSCNMCSLCLSPDALPSILSLISSHRNVQRFQDIHPCLSFVGWHRFCVPSWQMYAGYRRCPPSSTVCWQLILLGQEITQPVWWPLFCHCRANAVEQSAWTASATGHHLRTIQTIIENVFLFV